MASEVQWFGGEKCESGECVRLARSDDKILFASNVDLGEFATVDEFRRFLDEAKTGVFDPLVAK